jgi:hypothetical protein
MIEPAVCLWYYTARKLRGSAEGLILCNPHLKLKEMRLLAKEIPGAGVWVYNRHDRKRGTTPTDNICRNRECAANLETSGIHIYRGGDYMMGRFLPGVTPGGAIIEVMKVNNYSADILCYECNAAQPHLHLEDIYFDVEAMEFNEDLEPT